MFRTWVVTISFRDLGGHPGRFVPDSSPFRDLGGHPGRFVPESQIFVSRPGWSPRPIRPRFVSVSRPGWSPRPIRTVSRPGWSGQFVPDSSPFRDLGGHPGRFVTVSRPGWSGRFVPDSSPFRDLGGHPGRFVPESQISFRDLGGHPGRFVPDSSPFRDLGGHPGRFVPESQISFRDLAYLGRQRIHPTDSFQPTDNLVRKLKPFKQEGHFSYRHATSRIVKSSFRSSRNLDRKTTPWHKEHSNGLRSQDHILRTQVRLCAGPVPLEIRVFLTRNKLIHKPWARWKEDTFMHDVELSDRQDFTGSSRNPDRKTVLKRTKNTPVASVRGTISREPKLGFPRIRNLAKVGSASFPTVPRTSKSDIGS
uniref:Uncharacterized protein n=1 Tax=Fagus sylvatica TaxID=28930 RepID=A0A2N9FKS5_FAGSY